METLPWLSAAQMREADRRCIEIIGIPGAVLMNNAGVAVFRQIESGPVAIVCGKGNNGGDGFVVARLAHLAGLETRTIVLAERESITGDARLYLEVCERLGCPMAFVADEAEAARAVAETASAAVRVDAILGTGISGEVRGVARAAIDAWPAGFTIAVDLPSGMNADTGAPCGACIQADVTVTFQFPKLGFRTPAAQPWLGKLVVADIGIPAICAEELPWTK